MKLAWPLRRTSPGGLAAKYQDRVVGQSSSHSEGLEWHVRRKLMKTAHLKKIMTVESRASNRESSAETGGFESFSLVGGPINDLAVRGAARLGLRNNLHFGIALSMVLWIVLVLLAMVNGSANQLFSIGALPVHARLLVAIPLLFLCERLFDNAVRQTCRGLVRSGVVAGEVKAALDRDADRLSSLSNSIPIQLGLLLIVVAFGILVPFGSLPGAAIVETSAGPTSMPTAAAWYALVCLPISRFVVARFFWLLALWSFLLWRLSRRPLALRASHPDRAGGLGLLQVAQGQLVWFVLALATMDAAALAATYQYAEVNEQEIYLRAFLVAAIGVAIAVGPLLVMFAPLGRCRWAGLADYGTLAHEYASRFGRRWTEPAKPNYDDLLGASDIQSLADLSNSYANVRAMRTLPMDTRLLSTIICCASLPHVPLLLMKYPISELAAKVVQSLIGLP